MITHRNEKVFFVMFLLLIFLVAAFFFSPWGEKFAPKIVISGETSLIGAQKEIALDVADTNSGLARIEVAFIQNGTKYTAFLKELGKGEENKSFRSVTLLKPIEMGLKAGVAELEITASDRSLWKNEAKISQQVVFDFIPPRIAIKSKLPNYTSQGGSSVVVYEASKRLVNTSVVVQNESYSAFPLAGKNNTYVAFFALPLKGNPRAAILAEDLAGNPVRVNIPMVVATKRIVHDRIAISSSLLAKTQDFAQQYNSLLGKSASETFKAVNGGIREESDKRIRAICAVSAGQKFWEGAFLRMQGSATMAKFGDQRTYLHEGKILGRSVHLGVDLASTANAPIMASNNGIVVFAGDLGIYGNTVIIDHGLGLFSLYAHMDSIAVATVGSMVKKGQVIGKSGLTGLAVGDHLHFSLLIGGNFVEPLEWWDGRWVANNIEARIKAI
ncbi:MAG: M23 family metallopeptidase [Deltaproteobacteria bacterium]|nr:M23 family metallopeptidase [Deltaproteobacteria bacterium]